jgi:hypothetical protein
MTGFGDHHGFAGILHITGVIGLVGGIHTTVLPITYIGITAIGITIITLSAHIVQDTITMRIITPCAARLAVQTTQHDTLSVHSLHATPRATIPMHVT